MSVVSHNIIFQHILYLKLTLFPEGMITDDLLRLMDALEIFFCTNPDKDVVS